MVRLGNKVVLFGGGVFPTSYFDETWVFDLDLPLGAPMPTAPPPFSLDVDSPAEQPDLALVPLGNEESHACASPTGTSVRVHRRILVDRCPFFASMFRNPVERAGLSFSEEFKTTIELPEVTEPVLRFVVHYLYTGLCDFALLPLPVEPEARDSDEASFSAELASNGSRVELHGLKARVDLNGVKGIVKGYAQSSDRYIVALDDDRGEFHLKLQNLCPCKRVGKGVLATDGYVAVQHVLHLCALWALDHLRGLVEDAVITDLPGCAVPVDIAPSMLSLADDCHAPKLRLYALHALKRNWATVQGSQDFDDLPDALKQEVLWHVRSLLL
jgi:hypothetical protein